jgi:magnesium-transporting ATPase (P-type)
MSYLRSSEMKVTSPIGNAFMAMGTYLLLYNTMVPISLIVTLEIIKLI